MTEQQSLDLVVSGQLVSNHTILAIVEGMRARGYFRKGPQGRKDGLELATALKLVNEYMAFPELGRYTVEATKHRPINEIPRADYEQVEIMRACDNYLAQVTEAFKATAKTATIRPIESTFEGLADAYGWGRKYMPLPNCFTYDPIMGREASDNGKRLKVRDYSRAKNSPELELCGYRLTLWDGTPSICDTYN